MSKIINVKGFKIKIPEDFNVVKIVDVEEYCRKHRVLGKRCDSIIVLKDREGVSYIIAVENTGVPELRDLEKLELCIERADLFLKEQYRENKIFIKILHYKGGIRTPLLPALKAKAIEKWKCNRPLDFYSIYRRIKES